MKNTIPPATIWEFERLANEVCDLTELHGQEKSSVAYELQTFLQDLYQDGLNLDLNSIHAQKRAVELFGDPYAVARSFGDNRLKTLIFSGHDKTLRLILFIIYCAAVFMLHVMINLPEYQIYDIIAFPEFLGQGFVTIAIFYIVVRIKFVGLSLDNHLKVHFIIPFLVKIHQRFPLVFFRFRYVFRLIGRSTEKPSATFEHVLCLLTVAGLILGVYLTQNFMRDFISLPYKAIFLDWSHKIPVLQSHYYLNLGALLIFVPAQIAVILAVGSELFEGPIKVQSYGKYLSRFLYVFWKRLTDLLFPRRSKI